jgi:hypothetical protein
VHLDNVASTQSCKHCLHNPAIREHLSPPTIRFSLLAHQHRDSFFELGVALGEPVFVGEGDEDVGRPGDVSLGCGRERENALRSDVGLVGGKRLDVEAAGTVRRGREPHAAADKVRELFKIPAIKPSLWDALGTLRLQRPAEALFRSGRIRLLIEPEFVVANRLRVMLFVCEPVCR